MPAYTINFLDGSEKKFASKLHIVENWKEIKELVQSYTGRHDSHAVHKKTKVSSRFGKNNNRYQIGLQSKNTLLLLFYLNP